MSVTYVYSNKWGNHSAELTIEQLIHEYLLNGFHLVSTRVFNFKEADYLWVELQKEKEVTFLSDLPGKQEDIPTGQVEAPTFFSCFPYEKMNNSDGPVDDLDETKSYKTTPLLYTGRGRWIQNPQLDSSRLTSSRQEND